MSDRLAIAAYLLSWAPPYAVVYPTEVFFFFGADKLNLDGNIRVADLDRGKLTIAVHSLDYRERYIYEINETDGLVVEKLADDLYRVGFGERKVRFKIPRSSDAYYSLQLLPDEEFVGRIHDESGIRFALIFNHNTSAFYDILDEEKNVLDTLEDLREPFVVGKRTGFVFYQDQDFSRKILVGVELENIERNSYYDGPGDQVPYWIDLQSKLYKAYPFLMNETIDMQGVYLNEAQWRRVAIMPFIRYESFDDIISRYALCLLKKDKSLFWTCLTREAWNMPD